LKGTVKEEEDDLLSSIHSIAIDNVEGGFTSPKSKVGGSVRLY